jgi:hypothetical protein
MDKPHSGARRRRLRTVLTLAVAVLPATVVAAAAMAGTAPVAVLDSRADEFLPAAGDGVLSWSQNSLDRPRHFDTFLRTAEATRKVNAPGTVGWSSDIDGTRVVYQQVTKRRNRPDRSDLFAFDSSTLARTSIDGVNTELWEWRPSVSGDLVLFGRNNINIQANEWQQVVLYDRLTQETRILEVAGARRWLAPGQVNGNFATWERCERGGVNCDVFLYQVDTQSVTQLDDGGVQQLPGVVAADGTAYVVRVGGRDRYRCGRNVRILRFPLGGSGTVIATIPPGKDIYSMNVHTQSDGSDTLVFDRFSCNTGNTNVFRLDGADTSTVTTATLVRETSGIEPLAPSSRRGKMSIADRA